MSGIMGICYFDERLVDPQDIQRMSGVLAHRGPDGADLWVEASVGLGHRMLWSTPESLLEHLPFTQRHCTITADARIDNRDELIAALGWGNRPVEKITDSELILGAYQQWGKACPEKLLGDFAFAIWDASQQTLFCARDHLGVKPFYYYHQPGHSFLFASEIKALLCLEQVPRRMSETRFGDFLCLMFQDKVLTTYEGILRLPPAHSLIVHQSTFELHSYWSLDPNYELNLPSDEAYAEKFREIFTEAVRCRLRSAFPIASHLSGGLDSSSITCVAHRIIQESGTNSSLHTISNLFDKVTECDEREFIHAVLDHGDYIPHFVHADRFGPLSDIDEIWKYEDEALLGPSHAYPWRLNQAAQQAGVRVVLDGLDGDTTVCHGVRRLTELAQQGEWQTFLQEAEAVGSHFQVSPNSLLKSYGIPHLQDLAKQSRWIAFLIAVQQIHKYFGASRKRLILNYGLKSLIPTPISQLWQRLRGSYKPNPPQNSVDPLVNPNFADRIHLEQRIQAFEPPKLSLRTVKEEHWQNLDRGVNALILEQLDRYAAAFSLEARHPFMDKRLIEFCLAIPSEQKFSQGFGRLVMRRGLSGILPETVQWRGGKADMTANFIHGLLTVNCKLLDEVLAQHIQLVSPYINLEVFQRAYDRIASGQSMSDADCMTVWRAVILALWLHRSQIMP